MRSLTASFFLLIYLFAGTELHQLAKLNAFVSHFAEHRADNQGLTLLEFVQMHYFNGNLVDDDYAKDMQLPFKTADSNHFSNTYTFPPPIALAPIPVLAIEPGGLPHYDQSAFSSAHLADIWQPPKAC